ncbi:hypothetical protein TSAR_004426 [Trichomalopsis sarcophagae]|uniref:Uncharacterized protein n=1 Tax=Trichomalopsis sarcophagae TaxID=543379 RepID=A0A232FB38_9HYME|nr:hypothetical protein TSAR_004426 [Trichomalopsis sarcophagae]
MCSLKKLVRKGEKPLQQITRRLTEYESIVDIRQQENVQKIEFCASKTHYNGNLAGNRKYCSQYKILSNNIININVADTRNNCVMLKDNTIVNVVNIAKSNGSLYLIGRRCVKQKGLFTLGKFHSGTVSVNLVIESTFLEDWKCNMNRAKVFKISCSTVFITYPLSHTFV